MWWDAVACRRVMACDGVCWRVLACCVMVLQLFAGLLAALKRELTPSSSCLILHSSFLITHYSFVLSLSSFILPPPSFLLPFFRVSGGRSCHRRR